MATYNESARDLFENLVQGDVLFYNYGDVVNISQPEVGDYIWWSEPTSLTLGASYIAVTVGKYDISHDIDLGSFTIYFASSRYTHTIAYNANGGSGSMASTVVTDYNSGATNVTFASNGFTPPAHYHFGGWRINNTGTVYQPGSTYSVGANTTATAYAYWVPDTYTISTATDGNGTVTGGGSYSYGASATLTAVPNSGYEFERWDDNSTANPRTITVTGNATYTAYFKASRPPISVKVGGNWVQGTTHVKVNGTWVKAKKIYTKVAGTWRESQ